MLDKMTENPRIVFTSRRHQREDERRGTESDPLRSEVQCSGLVESHYREQGEAERAGLQTENTCVPCS